MNDTDEAHPKGVDKALAARALGRIDRMQGFVSDQVSSMAKWLMASLLALNGGGALAALNASGKTDVGWIPGILFLLGIATALLSGVAMQEVYNAYPEKLLENDMYWTVVSIGGERNEEHETELKGALTGLARFHFVPPLLGWVSAMLFLAGAASLGIRAGDNEKRHPFNHSDAKAGTSPAAAPSHR